MEDTLKPETVVTFKHKAQPFKAVLNVLKDLMTDVNIRFEQNEIRILGVDPEKVAVIQAEIVTVEDYTCTDNNVYVGVNVPYLYKALRGVGREDTLEMQINRATPNTLEITVLTPEKTVRSSLSLKSLDVPLEQAVIPDVQYDAIATLNATDLLRALRDVSHVSKRVALGKMQDTVTLLASGPMGVSHLALRPSWVKYTEGPMHGLYLVRYLEKFVKPTTGKTVDICFKQDFPLVVQYTDNSYMAALSIAVAVLDA